MKKIPYAGCSAQTVRMTNSRGDAIFPVYSRAGYKFMLEGFDITVISQTPATPVSSLIYTDLDGWDGNPPMTQIIMPSQTELVYRIISPLLGCFQTLDAVNLPPDQYSISFNAYPLVSGGLDTYNVSINYWGYLVKN